MDPLTRAAERFVEELWASWSAPAVGPGAKAAIGPNALRLVSAPDLRAELVKSLRLSEWQPRSRHPLVVVEADCIDEQQYLGAIGAQLMGDYAKLAEGLAEDGVAIEPWPGSEAPRTLASVRAQCESAGLRLARAKHPRTGATLFDGLALALVPRRVSAPAVYLALVVELCPASDGALLRLHAFDPGQIGLERALPVAARLEVDEAELLAYLKALGPQASNGPAIERPMLRPQAKRAVEKKIGRALVSDNDSRLLRRLLIDATQAQRAGQPKVAVKTLRTARVVCQMAGLWLEQAMVGMALATSYIAATNLAGAVASYRKAAAAANRAGHKPLEAQALLGLGTAYFMSKRFAEARSAYQEARGPASGLPMLELEATRMGAESWLAQGQRAEAEAAFYDGLQWAEAAVLPAQALAGVRRLGDSLVGLLRKAHREEHAALVQARVESISNHALAPSTEPDTLLQIGLSEATLPTASEAEARL